MIEHLKSGKFRGLAITTSTRFSGLPDTPTVAESGFPDFDVGAWFALVVPAGVPDAVVQRLNAATREVLAETSVRERLLTLGAQAKSSSPAELADRIASEIKKWSDVIEKGGIERI